MNNVPATSKDPITVSPISKPPNPVSSLLGNDDDSVTNSIKWSSKRAKSPVEVPNDNSGQSSKCLIASKPVLNDKVDPLNKLLIVSSKPADRSKENDTDMASTDVVSAVATKNDPKKYGVGFQSSVDVDMVDKLDNNDNQQLSNFQQCAKDNILPTTPVLPSRWPSSTKSSFPSGS